MLCLTPDPLLWLTGKNADFMWAQKEIFFSIPCSFLKSNKENEISGKKQKLNWRGKQISREAVVASLRIIQAYVRPQGSR